MERKGIVIRLHGGSEVLKWEALPAIEAREGELNVRVSHVGLNHLDTWVRRGVPGHDFKLPRIPGSDVAGVLENGQRVILLPSWGCGSCLACKAGWENHCKTFKIRGESADGGCCTELVVPADQVLPIPEHILSEEAASLPLTLLTAWHMLFVRARLVSGERVLVQAGGSGVGVMAVQLAKALGCEVHATNSSPIRREKLAQLGAIPHPYEEGLKGMDVVVESVGGAVFESSVRALGWGGRLVCCGATAGADAKLNLRMLFFKQLDILGSTMGRRQDLVAAWEWVKEGRIKPVLDRVLPIEQLGEGHRLLESREVFGKVVLRF